MSIIHHPSLEPTQEICYGTQLCSRLTHFHPPCMCPRPFKRMSPQPWETLSKFSLPFLLIFLWHFPDSRLACSPLLRVALCSPLAVNSQCVHLFRGPSTPLVLDTVFPLVVHPSLEASSLPHCAMASRLRQRTIWGGQRRALPGHYHRGEDKHLESVEGSSSGNFVRQSLYPEQEEEAPMQTAQRGRRGLRNSTIMHQVQPLPRKIDPLLTQVEEDDESYV